MIKTIPRGYQEEAISKALKHEGFALLGEQRTGKTLTSLILVDKRKPDVLFILCPKKAVGEWEKQIQDHLEFDWPCEVQIRHFEACTTQAKTRRVYRKLIRGWLAQGRKVFFIVDEAHRIKKRGTYQSRFVRSLNDVQWRLALTGTSIAQGLQDAWAIFDFIAPGVLGDKWEVFERRYLIMGGFKNKQVEGYQNEDEFLKVFHTYSHRITLKEAQRFEGRTPTKVRRTKVMVNLKTQTRRIYRKLERDLEAQVGKIKISTPLVLTLTAKLQQICGGYVIHTELDDDSGKKVKSVVPIGTEKLLALRRVLRSPGLKDKPVIVCVKYRHEIEKIAEMLEGERSYQILAGGRQNTWKGKFDSDIMIMQIQSGIAIDLSRANTYVFYSWDFSHINHEQSRFRVMSFNTEQVNYIYLIAKDTVDETIYEAISEKLEVATLICDLYRKRRHGKHTQSHSSYQG